MAGVGFEAYEEVEEGGVGISQIKDKSFKFYNDTIEIYFNNEEHRYYRFDENGNQVDIDGVTTPLKKAIDKSFALVPWSLNLMIHHLQSKMLDDEMKFKPFTELEFLQWMQEGKLKHKEKLNEAGAIGKVAHQAIEDTIRYAIKYTGGVVKKLINVPEEGPSRNGFMAAIDWMNRHSVIWLRTERVVYSREYEIAGTMDGLCVVGHNCDDVKCCQGRVFTNRKAVADWKTSNDIRVEYALQTAIYAFAEMEEFGEVIPDRWILLLGKEDASFKPWYRPPETFEKDVRAYLNAIELSRSLTGLEKDRQADNARIKALLKHQKEQEKQAEKDAKAAMKAAAKAEKEAAKATKVTRVKTAAKVEPTPVVEEVADVVSAPAENLTLAQKRAQWASVGGFAIRDGKPVDSSPKEVIEAIQAMADVNPEIEQFRLRAEARVAARSLPKPDPEFAIQTKVNAFFNFSTTTHQTQRWI